MFKNQMTPLTPGGDRTAHKGKGAKPFGNNGNSFNAFAKAPFSPAPQRPPVLPTPGPGTGAQPPVFPMGPPKPDVPIG